MSGHSCKFGGRVTPTKLVNFCGKVETKTCVWEAENLSCHLFLLWQKYCNRKSHVCPLTLKELLELFQLIHEKKRVRRF